MTVFKKNLLAGLWQVPIVLNDGRPSPQFIRWLDDIFSSGTFVLDAANAAGSAASTAGETADSALAGLDDKVDKTTQVIAGVGIDGGGALSGNVTLDANIQDLLNSIGATRGSILYRGASGWAILAPGTAGTKLTSNGAGADPTWT